MQKFSQGILTEALIHALSVSDNVGYSGGLLFIHLDHKDEVKEELATALASAIDGQFLTVESEPVEEED